MRKYLTISFLLFHFAASAQKVVTLDYYYNRETHIDKAGNPERFHYLWEDTGNTGFSFLGDAFKKQGAKLKSLEVAPTIKSLEGTSVYIIVDPDSKKENQTPNYIVTKDITEIANWVRAGGVLLMLANDSANVELEHFNKLAAIFNMHFNNDLQNHVTDDAHFEDGAITTAGNPAFPSAQKIFMKDVCPITISGQASALLKNNNGAVVIAGAHYGKGYVMAVGDPWLYNEYTNGRLPAGFENDKAANDIAAYLLTKTN